MKNQNTALLGAAVFVAAFNASAANYSIVHSFGVLTNVAGFEPKSTLVQDASGALYGTASTSEGNLTGTVFKIQPDGTEFQVLKSFSPSVGFSNNSGANPIGGLVLSGATLYGTTYNGGPGGNGIVFSLNTDGTDFTVLTNFPPTVNLTNSIGANPSAGLILAGGTLFGTTLRGGSKGNGTVFSLNVNGTDLTVLKSFSALVNGTNSDGAMPNSALLMADGMLYGTTTEGGTGGAGTVFTLNPGTSAFSPLMSFPALGFDPSTLTITNSDGAHPSGSLALSESTLFGTTSAGGTAGNGTVFTVNTNGTSLNALYTFNGVNDGGVPDGGVTISGNTIYGTASSAGATGFGTVFAFNTNNPAGTFTNLYEFNGGSAGGYPFAGLVLAGKTLYGATAGATGQTDVAGGNGTLFAVNTNGAGFTNIFTFEYSDGAQPYGSLISSGNMLYGTTYLGGDGGAGIVYQMKSDGSDYNILASFPAFGYDAMTSVATNAVGANPQDGLVVSGNTLYGTAYYGGIDGYGTVFAVNLDGSGFTNLYNFTDGADGAYPQGNLAVSGNMLYGAAAYGGANNNGTVFSINTVNNTFSLVKTFSATKNSTNSDGANPFAGLTFSNSTLYGTTYEGGANGNGTVFSINTGTSAFAVLKTFSALKSSTNSDGAHPYAGLLLAGSSLYGTVFYGGANGYGTVFSVNINGSGFTTLKSFSTPIQNPATGLSTNSDGANPYAGLALFGNTLYGTTINGGANGYGEAFAVTTNGGSASFSSIHDFDATDGANARSTLLFVGNALYGTALNGGTVGDGVVYSLTLFPLIPLDIQLSADGTDVILTWSNPVFSLQSAPSLTGVYTNVPNATSPYTNAADATQQFFRLQAN